MAGAADADDVTRNESGATEVVAGLDAVAVDEAVAASGGMGHAVGAGNSGFVCVLVDVALPSVGLAPFGDAFGGSARLPCSEQAGLRGLGFGTTASRSLE